MTQEAVSSSTPHRSSFVSRIFGQYIVKNRLQFKFSFIVFIFLAVATAVLWVEANWAINKMIQNGAISDPLEVEPLKNIILYTSILALAVTFGLALFFSHFVAGPLYRIEKTFENIGKGDLTTIIRLRKRDELQDTARSLNASISNLRHNVRKDRETLSVALGKMKKFSEKLRADGKTAEATELDQLIFDLENSPLQIKI